MNTEYLQLGAVAIIFIFAIKEFFAWQKAKKNNLPTEDLKNLLSELKLLNTNHLMSIKTCMTDGNEKIVGAINDGNRQMIQLLGEIRGLLTNLK
jgi:hypothetical protein